MLIDKATFVVVDTETTGMRPAEDRLLEIAGVRIVCGKVDERFQTLINPMQQISARITRINGISHPMVAGMPTAPEVLPHFVEFLGDAVMVAHNLRFDLGFLNAELARAALAPIANRTVCTLRLARRLLRGLPSKSLASLVAHYGITVEVLHRALADAEATSEVLLRLLALLKARKGLDTVEDLIQFQRRTYGKTGPVLRNVQVIRDTVLPQVPDTPGVYFMRDKAGSLLYIGKAKVLSRRVRSYFGGTEAKALWTRRLVKAVHSVSWTETKTELAALLLEMRLRKEHQPPFNRADRGVRNKRFSMPSFLRIGAVPEDDRITVVRHIRDDGADYYGPFAKDREAETIVKAFFSVYGVQRPSGQLRCVSSLRTVHLGGGLTANGLQEVRAFLREPRDAVFSLLEKKMAAASQALNFEAAAAYRDWIGVLSGLRRRQFVTGVSVYDRNAAVVLAHEEVAEIHVVRYGLPVDEIVLTRAGEAAGQEHLKQCLARHFSPAAARPHRYTVRESETIRLLSCWLHREQDAVHVIAWHNGMDLTRFSAQVAAAAAGRVPVSPDQRILQASLEMLSA